MRPSQSFNCLSYSSLKTSLLAMLMLTAPILVAQNNISPNPRADGIVSAVPATVTGQLKTRNHIVTIYASSNGPLYTVLDANGIVQGLQMSEQLLAKRFPVLKSMLDNPADQAGLQKFESAISIEANTF